MTGQLTFWWGHPRRLLRIFLLQLALCDIERAVRFIEVVHQKVIVGLISVVKQVAQGLLEQLHLSPCFGIHRVTARQSACRPPVHRWRHPSP